MGEPKVIRVKDSKGFIEKARTVHGDRFDYPRVDYKNTRTPVFITCRKHGEFESTPKLHLQTVFGGCPGCYTERRKEGTKKVFSEEKVAAACRAIHGDRFDYSKLGYTGNMKDATFICLEHGEFITTPWNHKRLTETGGCPGCMTRARIAASRDTPEKWLAKVKEVHGDTYDYSLAEYRTSADPVRLICREHGEFTMRAHDHTMGQGCRLCGIKKVADSRRVFHVGMKFGTRTLLENMGYTPAMNAQWRVICDCGAESTVTVTTLKNNTKCAACGRVGGDTWERMTNDEEWANGPAHFYVAEINDRILKPGIAADPDQRQSVSGGMYQRYLFVSPALARCEVWAIEQKILEETFHDRATDDPSIPVNWDGKGELRYRRNYSPSWYIERFHQHLDLLHQVGWQQLFILGAN